MRINNFSEILVAIDQFSVNIPFFSTITNLVDLFEKYAVLPFMKKETISKNYYFNHLNKKSAAECFVLLIPIAGTILFYKFFNHKVDDLLEQARRFKEGDGKEKDLEKALQIYLTIRGQKQEVEGLSDLTMVEMIEEYEKQSIGNSEKIKQVVKFYEQEIALGNAEAMYILACSYLTGDRGIEEDEKEAVKLMEQAADCGHPVALYNLAVWYEKGSNGLETNEAKALEFYQRAVEKGHPKAMYNFGLGYLYGLLGLEKNRGTAVELFKQAARQGHEKSKEALKQLKIPLEE